jgi:hypothetical protein
MIDALLNRWGRLAAVYYFVNKQKHIANSGGIAREGAGIRSVSPVKVVGRLTYNWSMTR